MNKANGTGSINRSARVRRIKRVLKGLIACLILAPLVLCIILFLRINKLEKMVDELSVTKETHTVVTDSTTFIEAKESEPDIPEVSASTIIKKESEDIESEESEIKDVIQFDSNKTVETGKKEASSKTVETEKTDAISKTVETGKTDASSNTVETATSDDSNTKVDVPNKTDESSESNVTLKRVYLTFDDGPSCNTEKILDILNEYDVKATFFVNGKEYDELKPLYKKIVDEGHTIGMHSYSHIYREVYSSENAFIYDLNKIQDYIYEQTGVLTNIYRFPGGSSNRVSKISMTEFQKILDGRNIRYYDWNVVSGDADSTYGLPADALANNVINGAMGKEEAIVLMHDLPEKATTVKALPRIIETFKNMGVEILPIDGNTTEYHQTVAN